MVEASTVCPKPKGLHTEPFLHFTFPEADQHAALLLFFPEKEQSKHRSVRISKVCGLNMEQSHPWL